MADERVRTVFNTVTFLFQYGHILADGCDRIPLGC